MESKGIIAIAIVALVAAILWFGTDIYKSWSTKDDIVIVRIPNDGNIDQSTINKIQEALK